MNVGESWCWSLVRGRFACAMALLVCLAGMPAGAQSLPERPWILVLAEIESPSLRASLANRRGDAERELGRRLSVLLSQRHPFVGWRDAAPASPPDDPPTAMGTLVARVIDVGSAAGGSPVELAWALRGARGDEALTVPAVPLYLPFESSGSRHDVLRFVEHAQSRLREKILVEGFDDQARRHVVSRLPIARGVEAMPLDRVVLLPLRWQDLRLGAASRLEVQVTQDVAGGQRINRATLGEVRERRHGAPELRGRVQAAVSAITEGSTDVPLLQQWSPRVPELLRGSLVECFLKEYRPAEAAPSAVGLE